MPRPTQILIDTDALLHNVQKVRHSAPGKKIAAMVKANAYGCGIDKIIPVLDGKVDAFGVASLQEALDIRNLQSHTPCILVQGVFGADEFPLAVQHDCAVVIHSFEQLQWLLQTPLPAPLKIWVKVNTGMHRLGFSPHELPDVVTALQTCDWVDKNLGLMTHFSTADQPENPAVQAQIQAFSTLETSAFTAISMANSAAILHLPSTQKDWVRPGIMLYGVSPVSDTCGKDYGLLPVMHFMSKLAVVRTYDPPIAVGYGGVWKTDRKATIGIVPAGYGDGYPRHVSSEAYVWIKGKKAPLAGRISMDMLAVDLTDIPQAKAGDPVELWGENLPVEEVARWADTIGYELLCKISARPRY